MTRSLTKAPNPGYIDVPTNVGYRPIHDRDSLVLPTKRWSLIEQAWIRLIRIKKVS